MANITEKYFLSCPGCNKVLFRYEGICRVEVKCSKCKRELIVDVNGGQQTIGENGRNNDLRTMDVYTKAS